MALFVFLSTKLTPHQIPFCNEMSQLCDHFYFVQMDDLGSEWEAKGEIILASNYNYLKIWNNSVELCKRLIIDADVLIVGGVRLDVYLNRLKKRKLTFIYLERFYKNGLNIKNFWKSMVGTYLHHGRIQKYSPYLLCASAYCAGDASIFHNYKGRMYEWGYFPYVTEYDYSSHKTPNSICWAGRLISWKHPDSIIRAATILKKKGLEFTVDLVGDGPLFESINREIVSNGLQNTIRIHGAKNSLEVRRIMQESSIFVLSSDYQEGWGAVLNEAMDSGCAVVCSHAAGSVPFLIKNCINGFIFEPENESQLALILEYLLTNPKLVRSVGLAGQKYLRDIWSPIEAARRFVSSALAILDKNQTLYLFEDGPMSEALPIKEKNMYRVCAEK